MQTSTIRLTGILTAAGAVIWGVTSILSPSSPDLNNRPEILTSGIFQLGLMALLALMWTTAATGTRRAGRIVLAVEIVLLVLAIAWTVPFVANPNRDDGGILMVLDPFWPLSMLGTLVVGVMVARAGRWPRPLRYLPMIAGLQLVVDLSIAWAPTDVRVAVFGTYLSITYAAIGLMIVRQAPALSALASPPLAQPELAGARR
jgi:hypothetical protein